MNNRTYFVIIAAIIVLGVFLRFYRLSSVPAGLHVDEASLGYDSFSLLKESTDQFGQNWPVFLRSFADYKSPLYAYLSLPLVAFLGLDVLSVRLLSAISGVIVVLLSIFIINLWFKSRLLTCIVALSVAISPWAIFYSRGAVETHLALSLFLAGVWMVSLYIVKFRNWCLFSGVVFLALSAYAYHSERLLSVLFLGVVGIFFWRKIRSFKVLFCAVMLFVLLLLPQLRLWQTDAFSRRLGSVNYFSSSFFDKNGGEYKEMFLGRYIYISREFLSQSLAYISARNLFHDADSQDSRSIPGMSVFYNWMVVPYFIGVGALLLRKKRDGERLLLIILFTSIVPAALTRDAFYTLRVLPFLWGVGVVIGIGIYEICRKVGFKVGVCILTALCLYSLYLFYGHYFILFKIEKSQYFGYQFVELVKKLDEYKGKKVIIDNTTTPAMYIYWVFLKRVDPRLLWDQGKDLGSLDYYNLSEFDTKYTIGNVEIRPINWVSDPCDGAILVGDIFGVSELRRVATGLREIGSVADLAGNGRLVIFEAPQTCGL